MSSEQVTTNVARELLRSRIGFILLAAACAIGLGNVWRFPYITGQYGGAIFVIIYLICLFAIGIPCVMVELSLGRASGQSVAKAFDRLEPKGSKWHIAKYPMICGTYVLMSFYTVITGWLLYYVISMASGDFAGIATLDNDISHISTQVFSKFINLLENPAIMITCTISVITAACLICFKGVQKGVENFTKPIMIGLLVLLVLLALYALTLDGAKEGLSYYLMPDLEKAQKIGWLRVIYEALNQAFFTLSVGQGSLLIFGSYIKKTKSLVNESILIATIDSFVAVMAGLVIFPACFSYGVDPAAGPTLLFQSMLSVFTVMEYGQVIGTIFFVFMFFAAFTTVVAVIESIIALCCELFNLKRKTSILINVILISLLSIPCVLGFNLWKGFEPLGKGTNILDLEDFFVSNNVLPFGALYMVIFCIMAWRYKNCIAEINEGHGLKLGKKFNLYMVYIMPILIGIILVYGYIEKFSS